MELFKSTISFAEKIENAYDSDLKQKFIDAEKDIINIFSQFLEKNDEKYFLTKHNSAYSNIKLYEFHSRVKESKSLREKIIRDNILEDSNGDVNNVIFSFDDIIGIKILTSLKEDCKNAYNLIKDNIKELEDKNIKLNFGKVQPVEMKNLKKIYKIKGEYLQNQTVYKFELQIKSHIESAWGDLDHILFYKDYDFEYIKENNKEIMNTICDLLDNVDSLMLTIRQGKEEFTKSLLQSEFYIKIQNIIKEELTKAKITGIDFHVAKGIRNVYDLFSDSIKNIDIKLINVDFNNKEISNDPIIEHNFRYLSIRNMALEITRILYYSILISLKQNTNEYIKTMVSDLLKIQLNNILCAKIEIIDSDAKIIIEAKIESIIKYYSEVFEKYKIINIDNDFIMNSKLMEQFISVYEDIQKLEIDDEYSSYIEDQDNIDEFYDNVKDYWVCTQFIKIYQIDIEESMLDNCYNKIKDILDDIEQSDDIKEKLDNDIIEILNKKCEEEK